MSATRQVGATVRKSRAATSVQRVSKVVSGVAAAAAVRNKGAKRAATTRLHAPCPVPNATCTVRANLSAWSKLLGVARLPTAAAAGERAYVLPTRVGLVVTSAHTQGGTTSTQTTSAIAPEMLKTGEETGGPLDALIRNALPSVGVSRTISARILLKVAYNLN
jgi:hypothetical protein